MRIFADFAVSTNEVDGDVMLMITRLTEHQSDHDAVVLATVRIEAQDLKSLASDFISESRLIVGVPEFG